MKILVVVLQMECGMSFKFTLREADPEEDGLPRVRSDPTGRPIICARFQHFDGARPIATEHLVFRPQDFSSRATDKLYCYLGHGLLPKQQATVNQFFSSVHPLVNLNSNSVGYFCFDVTREGWRGEPARAWDLTPTPKYVRYKEGMPLLNGSLSLTAQCFCDADCCICLERMIEGDQATTLPCDHYFHTDCLVPWLNTRNLCPLCRLHLPTNA